MEVGMNAARRPGKWAGVNPAVLRALRRILHAEEYWSVPGAWEREKRRAYARLVSAWNGWEVQV